MGTKPARVQRMAAVLFVAVLMMWPAFYNGFPLLYPDSMSYLEAGPRVARGLATGEFNVGYPTRGFPYALAIWPLHRNVTAWPILALNGLLVAWVLWLVVRALAPAKPVRGYLALATGLALLTNVGWFVGFVMPDILGPMAYLAFFLMAFCTEGLSRAERWALTCLSCWAIMAHSTHLPLTASLCVLIPLILAWQGEPWQRWIRTAVKLAAIVLAAALAQLGLHARLYGEASLTGRRPPFLLARVIADGPGRWYLDNHPPPAGTYLAQRHDTLPDNSDDFLWGQNGGWIGLTTKQREELLRAEMPIVIGTIRAYPWEELRIAWRQFRRQLFTFQLFDYPADLWTLEMFATILPGAREQYVQSREARGTLPLVFLTRVQKLTVLAALAALAAVWFWRASWPRALVGLTVMVFWILAANAAVTGVLSTVASRFQGRVIWLVPMVAGLAIGVLGRTDGVNADP